MKRLLFVCHRVPYPPDKGERLRAYNELKALAPHFRIVLASLAHSSADFAACEHLDNLCEKVIVDRAGGKLGLLRGAISLLGGGSVTEGFFRSRRLQKSIRREVQREPFDLALGYSSSTLGFLQDLQGCPRVIDLVDVDSAKWSEYAHASSWPVSWLYRKEAKGVRELEVQALNTCNTVLLVSNTEVQAMGVSTEKLMSVQNGVDVEYFCPGNCVDQDPPSLVFTGTMDYRPNIEGICWFVRNVWPDLKREVPDLVLNIVGRKPAAAVRRLEKLAGVNVSGAVPDVRPYLLSAKLAIVPLLIARGIQNKVLEAMAVGRAVVASTPALEGLELEIGKEVLRADSPDQWRQAIISLLSDSFRRQNLESAARACVLDRYTWKARLEPLVSLCKELTSSNQTERKGGSSDIEKKSTTSQSSGLWRFIGMISRSTLGLRILTVLYASLLVTLSVLPSGSGPLRGWDAAIPSKLQTLLHLPAYAILAFLAAMAFCPAKRLGAVVVLVIAGGCIGLGIMLEYAQAVVPGRVGSKIDIAFNSVGIMMGVTAAYFWEMWLHRGNARE